MDFFYCIICVLKSKALQPGFLRYPSIQHGRASLTIKAACYIIELGGDWMFEQTKALCQHFLKIGIPGFDLIVYKDGQCILRYMGGYADPENKIPMQGKEKLLLQAVHLRGSYAAVGKGHVLLRG